MDITKERNKVLIKGKIHSLNCSQRKGVAKLPVKAVRLIEDFGVEGDAHGAPGIKQVSLLAVESIRKQKECTKVKNKGISLNPGDFGENITTEGLHLAGMTVGDRFKIGEDVVLEISKIGKDCHRYCSIYYKTGDCIMPREGIFAKVLKGGTVTVGEDIEVMPHA